MYFRAELVTIYNHWANTDDEIPAYVNNGSLILFLSKGFRPTSGIFCVILPFLNLLIKFSCCNVGKEKLMIIVCGGIKQTVTMKPGVAIFLPLHLC